MKIDFGLLAAAVTRARGTAVFKKAQVESNGWFCLKKGKLSSFNGVSGTITNSGAPQELECCVPARRFAAAVAALDKQEGEITVTEGWMRITSGKYSTTLPTFSIFDFPELMPGAYTKFCEATNIADAIRLTAVTMETDESKQVTYGCGISGSYVYTTDGRRLTRAYLDSPASGSAAIGRAAVSQLVKLGQPDFLFLAESCLGALYSGTKTIVVSRLLQRAFPFAAVDSVLACEEKETYPVPPSLANIVDRVRVLADDEETQLVLTCKNKNMTIATVATGSGQTKDELAFDAPDFEVKVKAASLRTALKALKPDRLDLADVLLGDRRMLLFRGAGYQHGVGLMV